MILPNGIYYKAVRRFGDRLVSAYAKNSYPYAELPRRYVLEYGKGMVTIPKIGKIYIGKNAAEVEGHATNGADGEVWSCEARQVMTVDGYVSAVEWWRDDVFEWFWDSLIAHDGRLITQRENIVAGWVRLIERVM